MKAYVIAGALAVSAAWALPAAAQSFSPYNLLHDSYVEVEGGAAVEGRTKIGIEAQGLGASSQSASQDHDFFGGGLVGVNIVNGLSLEGEGIYTRNNQYFSPTNAVFGTGGATRTYGGLGNLKLSLPFTLTFNVPLGAHSFTLGLKPYISPGVGYGELRYTGHNGAFSYDDNHTGVIWQAKAGMDFRFGEHFGLDIAYRYLQSPDYNRPGSFNSPGYSALTRSHVQAVTGGLKYYF